MNDYEKIFQVWRFEAWAPSTTMRGGFRAMGATEDPGAYDFNHCQSVCEHELGTQTLVRAALTSALFEEVARKTNFGAVHPELALRLLRVAATHDLPEAQLAGDIPDDGTRNNELEDANEYYVYEDYAYIGTESNSEYEELCQLYSEFQQRNSPQGWLLYCADKTDAILTALEYASLGHPGSIRAKCQPTARDLAAESICKTPYPYDVFLVGFLDEIVRHPEYMAISSLFLNVIYIARGRAKNIEGGVIPDWIKDYEAKHGSSFALVSI